MTDQGDLVRVTTSQELISQMVPEHTYLPLHPSRSDNDQIEPLYLLDPAPKVSLGDLSEDVSRSELPLWFGGIGL